MTQDGLTRAYCAYAQEALSAAGVRGVLHDVLCGVPAHVGRAQHLAARPEHGGALLRQQHRVGV